MAEAMYCKCSIHAAKQRLTACVACAVLFFTTHAAASGTCIEQAARRFDLPSPLLEAVILQESSGQCHARHPKNDNGTYDIGCAAINSAWIPELTRRFGITEQALRNPCTNVQVGAWILAHAIRQHGDHWRAVGAYNAATESKRRAYAWKIVARLRRHAAR